MRSIYIWPRGCKHGEQAVQRLIGQMHFEVELWRAVVSFHSQMKRGCSSPLRQRRCSFVFDRVQFVDTTVLERELCFNLPSMNIQGGLHSPFVVLFFSLGPATAVGIQRNITRLGLRIKASKQVKKQRCYSPDSMLVGLQTPLPEVYSGGSLRSLP